MWNIIHSKCDQIINNKELPVPLRQALHPLTLIIYFFELLLGYDWRYARNWGAYQLSTTKEWWKNA